MTSMNKINVGTKMKKAYSLAHLKEEMFFENEGIKDNLLRFIYNVNPLN